MTAFSAALSGVVILAIVAVIVSSTQTEKLIQSAGQLLVGLTQNVVGKTS